MADPFVGEIRLFAGSFAPAGWFLCDGTAVAIGDYQPLYALLGTRFGGNGTTTFGLPNLCGRVAIGYGQGTGLTNRPFGMAGGENSHTLTLAEMPVHGHALNVANQPATTPVPGTGVTFGNVDSAHSFYIDTSQETTGSIDLGTNAVSTTGSGGPHANIMPILGLNYIICWQGIFPSFP